MKRILPPFFLLVCLISVWWLHRIFPIPVLFPSPWNRLGYGVIALGIALGSWALFYFLREKTTIHTFHVPLSLVTTGPFGYSRNPMYTGMAFVMIGTWIVMGSLLPIVSVIVFIGVADRWYIAFEEENMRRTFGAAYQDYCRQTRRWI